VKRLATVLVAAGSLVVMSGCPQPDPRVAAAENFKSTVFDLIGQDEAATKRLNGLHLGMSDRDVIEAAGAPEKRESRTTDSGATRETWVYNGQLSVLGTLTFEDGKLVQIQTN
jgi:uncharacterized protein DUF2845